MDDPTAHNRGRARHQPGGARISREDMPEPNRGGGDHAGQARQDKAVVKPFSEPDNGTSASHAGVEALGKAFLRVRRLGAH